MTYELRHTSYPGSAFYDNISFHVGSEDSSPKKIFFKPDGTKMYMIGAATDEVYQYSVSSAWLIDSTSYDNISFHVGSEDAVPQGLFFKPDGTKMYMLGWGNLDKRVYQYSVSSAWLIDSTSYDNISFHVGSEDSSPQGLFFKPDGTKMYMIGLGNLDKRVYQYSVSSAWLIDSTSYDNISFSVISEDFYPQGLFFKPDGTKMYMIGYDSENVSQYSVSSAWLIDSTSYDNISFHVGSEDFSPEGLFFKPDGTKMYMIGAATDEVYQYSVPNSWDLNSGVFIADVVSFSPEYDFIDSSKKIESRHRTRDGSEFVYKWADQEQISFSLEYVNSSDKSVINNFWRNNTDLTLYNSNDASVFSCYITNKSLPIGQLNKPYNNLFKGKLKLEAY